MTRRMSEGRDLTVWLGMVLLALTLSACGWQLRGGGQGSLADAAIHLEPRMGEGELANTTRRALRRVGASVVEAGVQARVLTLIRENTNRRTTSVDAQGRPTSYELTYSIEFAVSGTDDDRLLAPTTVSARDSYEASPLDTLAEQSERARLTEELRGQAVDLMLSRVARATGGE